jgi:nucleoside-diphosphate-sugar epimerase
MSSSANRLALVLGAAGGIGGETADALSRRGWRIRAMVRNPASASAKSKILALGREGWAWIAGDAMDRDAIGRASQGASIIVHAVNPAGYRNWDQLVLPMIDNTVAAAKNSGARVLLPGTIYNYGPDAFPVLREDSPQHPTTRKGAIRAALEERLQHAAADGARSLIVRAGDYFGPRPGNSWFSQALVRPGQSLKAVSYPGPRGVGHAWAYLPDVGETFARLADREAELPPFARFHFAGHWDLDGTLMVSAIGRSLGKPALKAKAFPWTILALISPFNETLRELVEMKPFWQAPIRLDNTQLLKILGAEPHTPLDEAVSVTLSGLGVKA